MDYKISKEFRRLSIFSESEQFYYKNKLFSLTSILVDQNENVVASLKRNSWWGLSFKLFTQQGEYDFHNKAFDSTLTSVTNNEVFRTNGSVEFYSKHGVPITNLTHIKNINLTYALTIHSNEHKIALIMASCLFYRITLEPAPAGYL